MAISASGLRLDSAIPAFRFKPSVGIVAAEVDKLGIDIRSFREPLTRAIKQVMIPSIAKNFDVEGRPAWEPLSEATIEIQGGDHPILNLSGALKRSMKAQARWDIRPNSAAIKELPQSVWYGYVHQAGWGGNVKSKVSKKAVSAKIARLRAMEGVTSVGYHLEIPQRQFVMFQPEDPPNIQKVFDRWIMERAAKAGFIPIGPQPSARIT